MLPTTRESEKERPPDSENPSPLHWFPSCLVDAGRQVVGALSPAAPPAAALPSSGPPPAMLPATGAKSSRAQVPQSLARQRLRANAEKVQIPAFIAAKVRQIDRGSSRDHGQDQAQGGEVSPGRSGRSGRRCDKGLPWCRPPALLPYSGHAPKRAAGAAPPRMSSRAKGKADISVSARKTPVKE